MNARVPFVVFPLVATLAAVTGCKPMEPNRLDALPTVTVPINGRTFELWIVDEPDEIERGLMQVTAEQMAPRDDGTERGMLFVFDHERYLSFWMKDTIIPLDIAYLDTGGTVVSIHTMAPLDTRYGQYPSGEPARFAIEVNAGLWAKLGLAAGDRVDIPTTVLKGTS